MNNLVQAATTGKFGDDPSRGLGMRKEEDVICIILASQKKSNKQFSALLWRLMPLKIVFTVT